VRDVQGEGGTWTPGALMGPASRKPLKERAGLTARVEVTLRTAAACWITWIVTSESAAWRARASNPVQWPLLWHFSDLTRV